MRSSIPRSPAAARWSISRGVLRRRDAGAAARQAWLDAADDRGSARDLRAVLEPEGIPLLINDRVDVALAAEADGVHIGQDDMPVPDARLLLGRGAIIGLSVKTVEQAKAAPLELLDYVAIGGVYGTTSKDNTKPPIGTDGLSAIVRHGPCTKGEFSDLRHCRDQCGQCGRCDRGWRRWRCGDLGPVACTRPRQGRAGPADGGRDALARGGRS